MAKTVTHCSSCSAVRQAKNQEPQVFSIIGQTEKKKLNVYWCQTCDGERKDA